MAEYLVCATNEPELGYEVSGPEDGRLPDGVGHFVLREAPAAMAAAIFTLEDAR